MPFYLFFGLLGLVAGGIVVWLLTAAHPFETREEPWRPPDELEAGFLAREMAERGRPVAEATVAELLELHTAYLDGRIKEEQARTSAMRIEAARAELAEGVADEAEPAKATANDDGAMRDGAMRDGARSRGAGRGDGEAETTGTSRAQPGAETR